MKHGIYTRLVRAEAKANPPAHNEVYVVTDPERRGFFYGAREFASEQELRTAFPGNTRIIIETLNIDYELIRAL